MGSDEDIGSPIKSDKPSPSTTQEQLNSHLNHEWANMQAYYGSGIPMQPPPSPYMNSAVMAGHSPYHPHMWAPPPQAMMSHYGVPYSGMYPPHGIVYTHPAVPLVTVDGQRQHTNHNKPSTKKIKYSNDKVQAEFNGQGSTHSRREHGMDVGSSNDSDNNKNTHEEETDVNDNNQHHNANVVDMGPSVLESGQSKREKRKQANRESARRSRLRKQSETEELMETYESLKMENISLKAEITELVNQSNQLRLENQALSIREETEETINTGALTLTQTPATDESKKLNFKPKKTKPVVIVG